MSAQIIPERLAMLDQLTVDKGSHPSFEDGHCSLEIVAWLAGLGHTDAPSCASPVLTAFTISLNDSWDVENRQRIKPFLPRMVGTAGDGLDETRSYLALDWLIRTYTPAWLDIAGLTVEAQALRDLRRIVDLVAAQAAGPVVRNASTKAIAAWAAAGAAARAAAGAAAGAAARAAAGAAAGAAAWDAAWAAAGAAARDALKPTVDTLQASALDLLDRMVAPASVQS
jgi:hypothetical protein